MALEHRLSDAIKMHLDTDSNANPVLEITFKYIRYRLTIDDMDKLEKMNELLSIANTPRNAVEEPARPKFYKDDSDNKH